MNNLSTREKVMIYILILIIIGAVGICLVILPTIDKVAAFSDELQQVEEEKAAQEAVIAEAANYQQQINDNKALVVEIGSQFYVPLAGEDLDSLFQAILGQYNLRCIKIGFNDSDFRGVMNFEEQKAAAKSDTDAGDGGETATKPSGIDESFNYSAYLSGNEVVLSGIGKEADVKNFAASFANNVAIKLADITWKKGYAATEFTAAFEVYMFDPNVNYNQIQPQEEADGADTADAAAEGGTATE